MLSPPRLSTSTLRLVAKIAPPASRDRASMRYGKSWGQRYNPHGAWPESSRGTDNGPALGLDTKATCTRLLHDVVAKQAVLSTPVNDQVLIHTPESREASVGEFLAQGNCDSVASTRMKPSTLITEYKILDVITTALSSAPRPPPLPPHTSLLHVHSQMLQ